MSTGQATSFMLIERPIYGSSRVGIDNTQLELVGYTEPTDGIVSNVLGQKQYELVNLPIAIGMGNVLSTVSDVKIPVDDNSDGTIDYYLAVITSATDYYPFGSPMDGRTFSSDKYRFGFNGQEKDDEVAGAGNTNTAEFWEYDTRLGRRWNLDPKPNPSISDYACFGNNPISNSDVQGDTVRKGKDCQIEISKGIKISLYSVFKYAMNQTEEGHKAWETAQKSPDIFNVNFNPKLAESNNPNEGGGFSLKGTEEISTKEGTIVRGQFAIDVYLGAETKFYGVDHSGFFAEEMFHAESFLNGEFLFHKDVKGSWNVEMSLRNELTAKRKVATFYGNNAIPLTTGTTVHDQVYTQLCYISRRPLQDKDCMNFLKGAYPNLPKEVEAKIPLDAPANQYYGYPKN